MSNRAKRITKAIKSIDAKLYAKHDGKCIRIFRESYEYRRELLNVNMHFWNIVRNDHLVMSLTDNWGVNGKPVDWGILPIMARLKALDLWNSDNLINQLWVDHEKHEKSKERSFRNNVESFLGDFRSTFAKATNDINTSSLAKTDKRRIGDKKLWQS
jgi:hypothetical protein